MSPERRPYSDTRGLLEDSLEILAQLRGKWPGDDLAAIGLLAALIEDAEQMLAERVTSARGHDHSWHDLAQALDTAPAEVRMRFDGRSPLTRSWLHG